MPKNQKDAVVQPHSGEERAVFLRAGVLCIILAVFDQITKYLIVSRVCKYSRIPVIPGFFDITYVTNPGAAWGMLSHRGVLLLSISMIVLLGMIVFFRKLCDGWRERYYALFLVVSGVLGNSYDRIFRGSPYGICDGEVVDFLSFHIGNIPWAVWPSFNIADSCICIGVGIFILSSFIRPDKERGSNAAKTSD